MFPWFLARRYLFAKKSTHAINLISGIATMGMVLGSMALIIILSVFNGFEDLLSRMVSGFKPDLQIVRTSGKVFEPQEDLLRRLEQDPRILSFSLCLEEIALFEYRDRQHLAKLKGVDANYRRINRLDTLVRQGQYRTLHQEKPQALAGASLEYALNLVVGGRHGVLIYMPKRVGKLTNNQPFKQLELNLAGIYRVHQGDLDNYLITDLNAVRTLLQYEGQEVSAIELAVHNPQDLKTLEKDLQNQLGTAYAVKNRYEQDADFFKVTNMEKWVGYLIFSFTLLLVAFNMVGALWMLVLEKKNDIFMLRALGAKPSQIRNIFLTEGLLMCGFGALIGAVLALLLCLAQQHFGLIRLQASGSFIIDAYPVALRWTDFVLVFATVLGIGGLAAYLPAYRAAKIGLLP